MSTNQKLILSILLVLFIYPLLYLEIQAQSTTTPDKPTNLQAFDVSPTRIDLFWATPQNNGGSPITGYKIQYKIAGGSYSNLVSNTGNATTKYSHTGLITGTTYIYRVSSVNTVGTSIPSSEAIATPATNSKPLENIIPNSPTSLTATDISPTSIKLTWTQPAANNGPPVVGYKIEFRIESGTFTTLVANTGNTVTTYTHSNLSTNTKYTYKISAINSVGTSSASNEASATPKTTSSTPTSNIAPTPPRTLKADPGGPTRIILSWKEPTPNNSPSVTGYKIEFKTSGNYTQLATTGTVASFVHDSLKEGTLYTYRVYAINSAGTSLPSNVISAKPAHTTVPTNLIADDISPTEILLTWNAPSQTYGGNIVGYTIQKQFAGGVYDTIRDTNDITTSYTVTGLKTGTEYSYVVKARYNIGTTSDVSNTATATPTLSSKPPSKFTVPNPPVGLTATAVSPIQIDLKWDNPTSDGGSQITGYKIEIKDANGNFIPLVQNTDSTVRTYSHTQRTAGITYTYKVYAINSVGISSPSNEVSATPTTNSAPSTPKENPSPPRSLVATAVSQNQINLSWQAPTNDGGEPISGYKIEAREGTDTYKVVSSNVGKNTAYSHTGLKPGTTYHYRISAINSIGTSVPSTETSALTQVPQPEPEPESNVPDFVDPKKGAQYYLDRYNNEKSYKDWFDSNFPDYTIEEAIELAIPGSISESEPESNVPDFVDPKKGAQYYLDRYNNEKSYKDWFDSNFPDYTIEEAIELAIPGSISEPEPPKNIAPFVDPNQDPQYYIDRYNNEPSYKAWFDKSFPDQTIYEAVGVEPPKTGICGPGTNLVDGFCEAEVKNTGGGCLIATATFGSELSPQVQSLRELRDNTLLQTTSGSSFMNGFNQFYYLFSPTVADIERENPLFREAVKITITPMISSLSILNYVDIDSEQEVLVYGLGVILLNIGMYFALPTFTILTVKRNLYHKSSRN